MRRTESPCRRAILDAQGNIAGWEVCRPTPKNPAVVRGGPHYGVWHDLAQAWVEGPMTLSAAVASVYHGTEGTVMYYGGGSPEPLNAAEMRVLRDALQ